MRVLTWSIASLFTAGIAAAERTPFHVGSVVAEPGALASGMVAVPEGSDPGTEIPITVLHGASEGPVVALIAGNHGYEYAPILALQGLVRTLDPTSLRGTVILVHVAAMPAFLGRTIYRSPVDDKNLNRVYPGKADGTSSERIADFITREVIERADAVIDLHSGDGNESLRPFSYMPVTGDDALDRRIRELVLAFGLDHIVVDRMGMPDPASSVFCDATAVARGIPAFTAESGFLGTRDEASVRRVEEGVLNVLRHLGLLAGEAKPVEHPLYLEPTEVLTSPATGILYPHVERGHTVTAGTLIATVTGFFGKEVAEVRAPFAGVVLYVVATPPISKNEPVAMIGAMKRP